MIYLNTKAKNALKSRTSAKAIIAGRGWGKSDYIGAEIYDCCQQMPRSLGALWGLTYSQILTKILPSAKKKLMSFGLREDRPNAPGHFTIGRKPPTYFQRPHNEPLRWENVICLFNGSACEFISVDRPELIAGGSYDWMIWDEAVYFPKDIHDTKCIPSLRGNRRFFGKCAKHGSRVYTSSQAWSPDGYWVEDQKWLRNDNGDLAMDEEGKKVLDPDFTFIHGTSYDNKAILGEKTLALWRRTIPKLTYDIEILAKRLERISNAFYDEFEKTTHTYIKSYKYSYDYEENEFGTFVQKNDVDRDGRLPMELGLDFGTSFNSMIVAQHHPKINELRFINVFFESNNQLITKMIKPFCQKYKNHPTKKIYLYGDPSGNKVGHMDTVTLFKKVEDYLTEQGWRVENNMMGKAYPLHKIRHQFINEILSEQNINLPKIRINMIRCKYLLTSMQNAPMDKHFKKNKSSERSSIPQETATHLSDAFDYLVYYKFYGMETNQAGGGMRIGGRVV